MESELTAQDREFIQQNFARFGEAWRPGLSMLEERFKVAAVKKWRTFEFELTTRDVFALRYTLTIHRKHGGMSHRGPDYPECPELDASERRRVDEVLRKTGELWLLEPRNGFCQRLDLSRGLEALAAGRDLTTRRREERTLLYIAEKDFFSGTFCLSVVLEGGAIEEIAWWNFPPMRPGRWIRPAEVEFIDRNLKANGDFGVYGNVQMGLRALADDFELKIRDRGGHYSFSVTPRDGYGHFLHFEMDKQSGAIGQAAAGHMEPRPREDR
ncbi:MAG: hypothetical protein GYA21_06595 [Myxococcales bacterium]|nr:hypothetical protein [Myxococcales bacterium]